MKYVAQFYDDKKRPHKIYDRTTEDAPKTEIRELENVIKNQEIKKPWFQIPAADALKNLKSGYKQQLPILLNSMRSGRSWACISMIT